MNTTDKQLPVYVVFDMVDGSHVEYLWAEVGLVLSFRLPYIYYEM